MRGAVDSGFDSKVLVRSVVRFIAVDRQLHLVRGASMF